MVCRFLKCKRRFVCFVLVFCMMWLSCILPGDRSSFPVYADAGAETAETGSQYTGSSTAVNKNDPPELNAGYVYVMDTETGRCLYEKNGFTKTPMASTTKIMTAIIVLEKGNLNEVVTVSRAAAATDGSEMHLKAGEEISVNDLLFGLLIKSGNDAAVALAEHIGGSVKGFCDMMNEKAKELGALDTNFTSPHGLDEEGHYTTARDLAIIAAYAMKNDLFRQIVSTKSATVNGHYLANTNNLLNTVEGVDGIKTGFTGDAGRCLVLTASRGGIRIIGVILGCPTTEARTSDGTKLVDYFLGNYAVYDVLEGGSVIDTLEVDKGQIPRVQIVVKDSVRLALSKDEKAGLAYYHEFFPEYEGGIKRNIEAGTVVGRYWISAGDQMLYETDLVAAETCRSKTFFDFVGEFFETWIQKPFAALYNL